MSLSVLLEGHSQKSQHPTTSVETLAHNLKKSLLLLQEWRSDEIIAVLDQCAKNILKQESVLKSNLAQQGLAFLLAWLREGYLKRITDLSLRGHRECLDRFTRLDLRSPVLYRAFPRGLTAHWIAGNVPILGFLSIAQALITKNASIAKAPSKNKDTLTQLISTIGQSNFKNEQGQWREGAQLLESIGLVYFEHDDRQHQEALSKNADLRVAWGGAEAIESIESLPKNLETQDLIFGPKYSYAVIGREHLENEKSAGEWAQRLSVDVAAFDQYACSSPHTVFIETGALITPKFFAELLARAMKTTSLNIPKAPMDTGKIHDILDLRATYDLKHEAFYSKGPDWTVLYSDEEGLANPCFSRVIFVRPTDDVLKITEFTTSSTQTIGVALNKTRRQDFAELAGFKGALRLPAIGSMSAFDTPWDGMFPMERMVRWVTTHDD